MSDHRIFSVPMLPSNSIACREVRCAKGCALLGVDGGGMGVLYLGMLYGPAS